MGCEVVDQLCHAHGDAQDSLRAAELSVLCVLLGSGPQHQCPPRLVPFTGHSQSLISVGFVISVVLLICMILHPG